METTGVSSFVVKIGLSHVELAQGSPFDAGIADLHHLGIGIPWSEVRRIAQRIESTAIAFKNLFGLV
jgi:hypothetical protein